MSEIRTRDDVTGEPGQPGETQRMKKGLARGRQITKIVDIGVRLVYIVLVQFIYC